VKSLFSIDCRSCSVAVVKWRSGDGMTDLWLYGAATSEMKEKRWCVSDSQEKSGKACV
jgi:hypothetical protein